MDEMCITQLSYYTLSGKFTVWKSHAVDPFYADLFADLFLKMGYSGSVDYDATSSYHEPLPV